MGDVERVADVVMGAFGREYLDRHQPLDVQVAVEDVADPGLSREVGEAVPGLRGLAQSLRYGVDAGYVGDQAFDLIHLNVQVILLTAYLLGSMPARLGRED